MKTLLRSLFIADSADSPQQFLVNHQKFLSSGLGFDVPEYNVIWEFIREFVRTHNHTPDVAALRAHFMHLTEDKVLNEVEHLVGFKSLTKGDFESVLNARANDRRLRIWSGTLKEAAVITQTGMEVKDGKDSRIYKGAIDSARYVIEKARDVVAPTLGGRLSGEVTKDGKAVIVEYETVEADPLAGLGQMTFLKQMDVALSGAKRYELWIHAAFTGGMKCLSGGVRVMDVKTGLLRTVQEIYDTQDLPILHALDEGAQKTVLAQVGAIAQNGVRPIFKLTSDKGRSITVSGNHPFLTPHGWVEASTLQPGDWLGTPASLPNSVVSRFTDAEVALVGYFLGDGTIGDGIGFTNSNSGILSDFIDRLNECGYAEKPSDILRSTSGQHFSVYGKTSSSSKDIHISRSDGTSLNSRWVSPIRLLLDRLGLFGLKAAQKHVPGELWGITDQQVWILLSALWSTDGRVAQKTDYRRKPSPTCWYGSTSQQLCVDVQALLQRVGVPSTVTKSTTSYKGEPYDAWVVQVTTSDGKARFLAGTRIKGKEAEASLAKASTSQHDGDWVPTALLSRVGESVRARSKSGGWLYCRHLSHRVKVQRDTFRRLAHASGDAETILMAEGDVRWERLTSITLDGEEMTYDLSVPGPANFVANGFFTHNSTLMLNWAYSQAVIYKHDVLIFSLEMPYNQCRRILYAMHSLHPKFRDIRVRLGLQEDPEQDVGLPYSNIRDGNLHLWHPNAKRFFTDFVVPDFNGGDVVGHPFWKPDYGKVHIEVADPDKSDFTVADLRSMAEVLYGRSPFAMIFVDHCGLMSPRRHMKGTTENINEVIRDLKKLALGFNRGLGIAVVGLFQISREGYKSALKAKEKTGKAAYNLTHLSYANEAERCVTISGTYVRTQEGFQLISSVVGAHQRVASASGWKQVRQVFHNGIRRIWDVTTDRGSKLGCTAHHRVRVVQDGQLIWGAVSELRPGRDYVGGTFGEPASWPMEAFRLPDLRVAKYETVNGRKGEGELGTPHQVTPALAYLLGAWDGDGKIHPKGVAWTGNRKETAVRDRLRTCFERTFGHILPLQESPSRLGSFDLVKWSQPLKRWFEAVAGQRAGDVPTCILQSPRKIVCAYLQGLFDTDGWVNNQGVVGINMKGACEDFLRQVQMLLTALGIDSDLSKLDSLSRKTGKTYSKVLLRVRTCESARRFHQDIGFSQEDKQAEQVFGRESCKQMYPVPQTFLSAYAKVHPVGSARTAFPPSFFNLPAKVRKTGVVPRSALVALVQYASEKGVKGTDIQFLQDLLRLQVMQVRSVVDTGRDEPVMDLEVEGDHEYQTGPVLSHNSGDIVTAGWIDEELRGQSRLQLQCLKARDHEPFEPFIARVEWPCRRILTCYEVERTPEENAKMGAEVDKAVKDMEEGK